jgi:hypothetical protein
LSLIHDPVLLAGALMDVSEQLNAGTINFQEGIGAIKSLLQRCDHLSVERTRRLPPGPAFYYEPPQAVPTPPAPEPVFRSAF